MTNTAPTAIIRSEFDELLHPTVDRVPAEAHVAMRLPSRHSLRRSRHRARDWMATTRWLVWLTLLIAIVAAAAGARGLTAYVVVGGVAAAVAAYEAVRVHQTAQWIRRRTARARRR